MSNVNIFKTTIIQAVGGNRPSRLDSNLASIDPTTLGFVELDTTEAKIYNSNVEANQFYEL